VNNVAQSTSVAPLALTTLECRVLSGFYQAASLLEEARRVGLGRIALLFSPFVFPFSPLPASSLVASFLPTDSAS